MESWQVEYINKHLVELQNLTICNVQLLAFLKSHHVIDQVEIEQLERLGSSQNIQKASELFTMIRTRIKGYEILVKGLFEFSQSGALKILLEGYESQGIRNAFQICNIKVNFMNIVCKNTVFQKKTGYLIDFVRECFLFGSDTFHLSGSDYVQLIQKNENLVLFANTAPNTLQYYVDRYIQKQNHQQILNSSVFRNKSKDVFVIKGISRAHLSKLATPFERTCVSSEQIWKSKLTVRFILLENDTHFDKICSNSTAPTHLIHCESEAFQLIASHNGIIDPEFIKTSESLILDENQFTELLTDSKNPDHILISDTPGMGKTEFMVNIANKLMEFEKDCLIIFVKFDEFCKTMAMETITFDVIWENLLKIGCNSYLGRQLLTYLCENYLMTRIFFDGFDEVLLEHQDLSFNILECIIANSLAFNIQVILSTRPHNKTLLEQKYSLTIYSLFPFRKDDQLKCILQYWQQRLHIGRSPFLDKLATQCLIVLETKLNTNIEEPVAGLPLLCRLIAEFHEDLVQVTDNQKSRMLQNTEMLDCTLISLYRKLFTLRLRVTSTKNIDNIREAHYRYSVKSLFPDWIEKLEPYLLNDASEEDLLRTGVIEKVMGNIRFVHRTFAEYLLAQFLIDSVLNDQTLDHNEVVDFLLKRIFTTLGYTNEVNGESITSYKFIYPVICFFMNGLIEEMSDMQLFGDSFSLNDVSYETLNVELCYEVLYAAVSSKHVHLFRLIRKIYLSGHPDIVLLQLHETKVEWKNLVLFAAKYSSADLLDECLDFLQNLPTGIPDTLSKAIVITTVQRGTYSLFEIAFNQFLKKDYVVEGLSELLRVCIRDTKSLGIEESMDIFNRILDFQDETQLYDRADNHGNTVLFEQNINTDILLRLAKRDINLAARRNISGENIIHSVVKYLSPVDLHRFLTLPIIQNNILNLLETREKHNDTAFHVMLMHISPLNQTIRMITSLPGFDISHFDEQDRSLLSISVQFKRDKHVLKDLVNAGASMTTFLENPVNSGNEIHFALKSQNIPAINFFLEQGVNMFERNKEGETPWEYANRLYIKADLSKPFMLELRKLFIACNTDPARLDEQLSTFTIQPHNRLAVEKSNVKGKTPLPDFYGSNFKPAILSLTKKQDTENLIQGTEFREASTSSSTAGASLKTKHRKHINLKTVIRGLEKDIVRLIFEPKISPRLQSKFVKDMSILLFRDLPMSYRRTFIHEWIDELGMLYNECDSKSRVDTMEMILLEWASLLHEQATLDNLLLAIDVAEGGHSISDGIRNHYKLW